MIRYNRLFALLATRGMKKTDLLEIISAPTLAKLSKGETIKTDIIEKICLFLGCQPSDIMEIVTEEELLENGKTKAMLITKDKLAKEYNGETIRETYIDFLNDKGEQLYERDDLK
ncbi:MAG: helix-turn-helix domain-containing protein [Lachnospiraceae bacterium]|nr:helix-turn-helix domain-containing protein [Lachnospiraceae bacterium]